MILVCVYHFKWYFSLQYHLSGMELSKIKYGHLKCTTCLKLGRCDCAITLHGAI